MNRQVEANLSMVVSKALGGLNMNALKYLLPLWIAPVTGYLEERNNDFGVIYKVPNMGDDGRDGRYFLSRSDSSHANGFYFQVHFLQSLTGKTPQKETVNFVWMKTLTKLSHLYKTSPPPCCCRHHKSSIERSKKSPSVQR